jgi:hypothetical protein
MSVNRTPTILKYALEFYCVFLILFKKGVLMSLPFGEPIVVGVLRTTEYGRHTLPDGYWLSLGG